MTARSSFATTRDTLVTQNVIRDSDAGMTFHGNTNADISYNQIVSAQ